MSHATLPVQPALPEQPQQITQMQPQRNMGMSIKLLDGRR